MAGRKKSATKSIPQRLKDRYAEQWAELIMTHCHAYQWAKLAATVWWDFVSGANMRSNFVTNEWFREHLDAYTPDCEIPREELSDCLRAIGYTKQMVEEKLKVKWLDVMEEQMKKKDPSYVRKTVGSYNR